MRVAGVLALVIPLVLSAWPAAPQTEADLEEGCILIADRSLRDPNFAETVILITSYGDDGTMGVIVNRRTDVPVSKLLDDWKESRRHSEPVYIGGPVERRAVLALLRSSEEIGKARRVFNDVHMVADRALLRTSLAGAAAPEKMRVYVGYAGWGPEQLEDEVARGAWHVLPGNSKLVFDPDPETEWERLIKQTETQIALSIFDQSLTLKAAN